MDLGGQAQTVIEPAERKAKLEELAKSIEELRQQLYRVEAERDLDKLKQVEAGLDRLIAEYMWLQRG